MPLLKPPEPQIALRKFYIRIEEPLSRCSTNNLCRVASTNVESCTRQTTPNERAERVYRGRA
jgi:hypothetical protein